MCLNSLALVNSVRNAASRGRTEDDGNKVMVRRYGSLIQSGPWPVDQKLHDRKIPPTNFFFYSNPLALDYAAHVGVVFACLKSGTRQQKMQQTLE